VKEECVCVCALKGEEIDSKVNSEYEERKGEQNALKGLKERDTEKHRDCVCERESEGKKSRTKETEDGEKGEFPLTLVLTPTLIP
jgi:hypothetical protein